MEKILIATDGSPSAQEAVDVGIEMAVEQEADLVFLHVLPPDEFLTGIVRLDRWLPRGSMSKTKSLART